MEFAFVTTLYFLLDKYPFKSSFCIVVDISAIKAFVGTNIAKLPL